MASVAFSFNNLFKGWISGVYGLSTPLIRNLLWQEVADLLGICSGFWCIGGDFNVVQWVLKN